MREEDESNIRGGWTDTENAPVDSLVMVMRENGHWIGSPDFWATVECGMAERIHRELNITIDRCIELVENIADSNANFFGCTCEKEITAELAKLKRP